VIYCANAGDSRTILWTENNKDDNDATNIIPLSFDHKPENPVEKNRVTKAGGFIIEGIYHLFNSYRKDQWKPKFE